MDEILQVHHISRSYMDKNHPFRAVEDVSFSLHAGEMLGIVGLSGSGKSTVLRMAGALEEPEKGNIQRPWARDKDFYRHIQMVFQDPLEAFSPRMTIHEFLLEPLLNFHMANREEAESRIRQMMKQTDIPEELLTKLPHQVSGGQLQRIVIARALLVHPELILFDEPTSALDVVTQERILHLIRKEWETFHFAGLFVSHDLAVVQEITGRVLVMEQGHVVERLLSKDLRKGLHPCTRRLISAQLPEDGHSIPSAYEKGILYYDGNQVQLVEDDEKIRDILGKGAVEKEVALGEEHRVRAYCRESDDDHSAD